MNTLKNQLSQLMLVSRHWFYVALALIFAITYIIPTYVLNNASTASYQTYDLTTQYSNQLDYFPTKNETKKVVVIDIDEATLASMSDEYGRWPWPRSVLAEFLEYLSLAEPAAVGIDVLFTDPDKQNIEGDSYLDEVIGSLEYIYLSALRLPAHNDKLSAVSVGMLPSMGKKPSAKDDKVAVLLPFLPQTLDSQKFGMTNFAHLSNGDGIVRHYPVALDIHGYRIPTLAAQLVKQSGGTLPKRNKILLNYLSAKKNIQEFSFAETFKALQNEDTKVIEDLSGAVIVIGSSAPGLFAVKPTPMNSETPGVLILATAVENLLNKQWYEELNASIGLYFLIIMLIFATIVFIFGLGSKLLDLIFIGVDFIAIFIAAGLILSMDSFADITFASHFAIGFYATARICQVIFRQQLREGRLLIGHKDHPSIDLVCGSYRYKVEEDHIKNAVKLRKVIEKTSPHIAFSDTVFNKEIGLLLDYATNGGLFYAVTPKGTGEEIMRKVKDAIIKLHPEKAVIDVVISCNTIEKNRKDFVEKALSESMPSMLEHINKEI